MNRVFNFSAGPSMMPVEVLQKVQAELLNYDASGQSVMELSHRSSTFLKVIQECETRLRDLMNIPDNYKVMFLQGGASLQFSMIPANLAYKHKKVALINTGAWSKKAYQEHKKFCDCEMIATSEDATYSYIPKEYVIPSDIDYLYICENNTIYGTKYKQLPVCEAPIVADLSSCICSEPIDVSKYGLVFAGAQKNLGPAGLTIVIVREDLIQQDDSALPSMLSYPVQIKNDSMFNTPPTFAIYVCNLMLKHLQDKGGLAIVQKENEAKAALLYDFLDQSKMFRATVAKEYRSLMNVPFVSISEEMDKKFLSFAQEQGLVNLKGHRSVGGMRASIYNAMPYEGVEKLVQLLVQFEEEHNA